MAICGNDQQQQENEHWELIAHSNNIQRYHDMVDERKSPHITQFSAKVTTHVQTQTARV